MGTSATFESVNQGVNQPSAGREECQGLSEPYAEHDTQFTPQFTPQECEKSAPNGHLYALTPCEGGASRVCGFCGKTGTLYPTAYGDAEAELHAECRAAWKASL